MGAFGGIILTNKGRNLQAKAQTGVELKYSRIGIGDGQLAGQSIPTLTKLISEKKSLPLTKLKLQGQGKAVVGTVLSNQEVTTGFYFRELGIYAQDPDEGEILYGYGNSGANAEYIPPAGGADIIEKSIDVIVIVGQAQNVTAVIDSSLVWATHDDVSKALTDAKAYTDQKVADIDLSKITPESIGAETPAGAQAKANQAETNAKAYAAPKAHTHAAADITSGTIAAARLPLSDAVNSTSTQHAATANAVKQVYDELIWVKQSVVDGKGVIAGAINGKGGGPVSANNTFPELAAAISNMSSGGTYEAISYPRTEMPSAATGTRDLTWKTMPAKTSAFMFSNGEGTVIQTAGTGYESHIAINLRDALGREFGIMSISGNNSWVAQQIHTIAVNFKTGTVYVRYTEEGVVRIINKGISGIDPNAGPVTLFTRMHKPEQYRGDLNTIMDGMIMVA